MPPKKATKKQTKKPEESKTEEVSDAIDAIPIVLPKEIAIVETQQKVATDKNNADDSSQIEKAGIIKSNIIVTATNHTSTNNGNENKLNIGSTEKNFDSEYDMLPNENEQKQPNVLKTKLQSLVNFKNSNILKNEAELKKLGLRKLRFSLGATSQVSTLTAEEVNK